MVDSRLPSLRGIRVLVVDDDEATRYVLARQLAPTGAIIKTAKRCGERSDGAPV